MIVIRRPLLVIILLLVGGCHGHDSRTSDISVGQVVAQVGGRDITINELNAELSTQRFASTGERKHAEQAALQGLIARTILANIARDQRLDQEPSYILQQHRANEILLAQNLQADIAAKVAAPTDVEISAFIEAHPELFANRKIYTLDQIKFRVPDDARKLSSFRPLKSLTEIEQRLIEDRIPNQRANATLDVLSAEPEIATAITKLPTDEVFLVPKNDMVYANHIISAKLEPFGGPRARAFAAIALQNAAIERATVNALGDKVKAARAAVRYQPGYTPKSAAAR